MPIDSIVLETIRTMPDLTEGVFAPLLECALVCLDFHDHKSRVKLKVDGTIEKYYVIRWESPITKKIKKNWRNQLKATENGAYCIALLLAIKNTEYNVVESTWLGTGFDFWLGNINEVGVFSMEARLEVSGILKGKSKDVGRRIGEKIKQTDVSDDTGSPAYIIVVEFSMPMCRFIKK